MLGKRLRGVFRKSTKALRSTAIFGGRISDVIYDGLAGAVFLLAVLCTIVAGQWRYWRSRARTERGVRVEPLNAPAWRIHFSGILLTMVAGH